MHVYIEQKNEKKTKRKAWSHKESIIIIKF
jgi:hypothetical protein